MIKTHDVCSLTEFQRNARAHVERLKETRRPEVLTINGKAELVVQDASAYQEFLDRVDRAEAILGIHRGLRSMEEGTGQPLDQAFAAIREALETRSADDIRHRRRGPRAG